MQGLCNGQANADKNRHPIVKQKLNHNLVKNNLSI